MKIPVSKNQIIDIEITSISQDGNGVGKYENFTVFVPMTAVGDILKVKVVKLCNSYAYGIIHQILTPSSSRIDIDCDVFQKCGGCCFRHINYESECQSKCGFVYENLKRIGGLDIKDKNIVPSQNIDRYRNKAQYPVRRENNEVKIGFFSKRSHRIVHCTDCKLQPAFFKDILLKIIEYIEKYNVSVYDEVSHKGLLRHVFIRYAEKTNETMLCLVINGDDMPDIEHLLDMLLSSNIKITTLCFNENKEKTNIILGKKFYTVYGKGYITDEICNIMVDISPLSFYQVNRTAAQGIYNLAADFADFKGDETLLDLYCGTGTISLSMAHRVKNVIGVEIIPQAIEDAIKNAAKNNINNARFICDDAFGAVDKLEKENISINTVILDPPRKGCDVSLLEVLKRINPEKIIYISCNPATLARDCKMLSESGFLLTNSSAVDMFPRTGHVESVVLMSRV